MVLSEKEQAYLINFLCISRASICANLAYNAEETRTDSGRNRAQKYFELETYYSKLADKVKEKGVKSLSDEELQKILVLYKTPHVVDIATDMIIDDDVPIQFKDSVHVFPWRRDVSFDAISKIYTNQRKTLKKYVNALRDLDKHTGTKEQEDITNI